MYGKFFEEPGKLVTPIDLESLLNDFYFPKVLFQAKIVIQQQMYM